MEVTMIFIYTIGFFIYFLPTIIGWDKRNSNAILALNLFLGWTFLGWVLALVWSLSKDDSQLIISKKTKKKKSKRDKHLQNIENTPKPTEQVWNFQDKNR